MKQAEMLGEAIYFASAFHRHQMDKSGQPYILHPLRVMNTVLSVDDKTVAVLHDTVEDTEMTLDMLRGYGFPERIVEAVDALTRREGETYSEFIQRVNKNAIATRVKIADIKDNLRPGGEHLRARYLEALKVLVHP